MRQKVKFGNQKLFNLTEEEIKLIEDGARMQGLSQSDFVGLLARNWDSNVNPAQRIKIIKQEKNLLMDRIREMEKVETKLTEDINKIEEWRKLKSSRKEQIIGNIIRIVLEGRYEDAENIAKMQGLTFGMTGSELLAEAIDRIKTRGI